LIAAQCSFSYRNLGNITTINEGIFCCKIHSFFLNASFFGKKYFAISFGIFSHIHSLGDAFCQFILFQQSSTNPLPDYINRRPCSYEGVLVQAKNVIPNHFWE
jgi:hypothetical protein